MSRSKYCLAIIFALLFVGCSANNDSTAKSDSEANNSDNTVADNTTDNTTTETPATDNTTTENMTAVQLDSIYQDLINELAGYQSEWLAEKMYRLAARIQGTASAAQLDGSVVSTELFSFDETSTRESFNCQFGGTMVTDSINSDVSEGGSVRQTNSYTQYTFDQCVTAVNGDALTDDQHELNGRYTYEFYQRSASGGSIKELLGTWSSFTLQQVNGIEFEFDGLLSLRTHSTPASVTVTRDSQINRYAESSDTAAIVELTDVDFYQRIQNIPFVDRVEGPRTFRVKGTYTGSLAQNKTLQISTDPEFTEWKSEYEDNYEPLIGGLQISSIVGDTLTITADNGPLTISFLSADGTSTKSTLDEWPVFDFRGSGCVPGGDYFNEMPIDACEF